MYEINAWDALGGDRLLILFAMLIVWVIVCTFINKVLDRKSTSIIAGVGTLVIIVFWAIRILN